MSAGSLVAPELHPVSQAPAESAGPALQPTTRNLAVDAYRGLVMLLMMGEVLSFAHVAKAYPGSIFWRVLGYNQSHVEWTGMSLHDTIQPSFTFLVGVAMPYSLRSRIKKGRTFQSMLGHTIWRSVLLIALGIFLRSLQSPMTNFTFEDTLTQIGLGYTFAFLLSFLRPRWQWTAFGVIVVGYWLAWAMYPVAGPGFDWSAVGVDASWHQHLYRGFAAHWNKNANLGQAFDVWFLNRFPRPTPFLFNEGGYLTLSFIPTLATMLLGLFAGQWLLASAPRIPFRKFGIAAALLLAGALLLQFTGICPIVKRIWTPAWVLWSGGICFLYLMVFSWLVDVKGYRKLAYPLVIVGMNSIAAYLMAHLFEDFIQSNLQRNTFGLFHGFGATFEPLVVGAITLLLYWLLLRWMYQNKVFIRI